MMRFACHREGSFQNARCCLAVVGALDPSRLKESQDGPWYIAYCAEAPEANGQGKSREECIANLREEIALILEHRREESLRSVPRDAQQELVVVG
jgi:predicted RNase H-like HicB family nuclease